MTIETQIANYIIYIVIISYIQFLLNRINILNSTINKNQKEQDILDRKIIAINKIITNLVDVKLFDKLSSDISEHSIILSKHEHSLKQRLDQIHAIGDALSYHTEQIEKLDPREDLWKAHNR